MEKTDNRKRPYPHFKYPDEINISVEKLESKEAAWYGTTQKVAKLTTTNYGWFPVEVVAGIKHSRFDAATDLSKKNGWIVGNGSLGTTSTLILQDKLDVCIATLRKAGYNIEILNN